MNGLLKYWPVLLAIFAGGGAYAVAQSQISATREQVRQLKEIPAQVKENAAYQQLNLCKFHQPRVLVVGSKARDEVCWCEYRAFNLPTPDQQEQGMFRCAQIENLRVEEMGE